VNRRDLLRLGSLAAAGAALGGRALGGEAVAFDVVLRGGTLVDGLGGTPFAGDLALAGDRIAAVAPAGMLAAGAARSLDVAGKIVCPGFVDLHSHSDFSLSDCPTADSRIRQGITTEITGNCGSSAAPAAADGGELGVAAWFDGLEARRLAVNVALLVGHGTLRERALGSVDRPATDVELARMVVELETAMDAGAIGLSTGLEYVPGIFTPTAEIEALARVVARRGRLYASHLRNEVDAVLAAVDEAVAIARATGVRTQISHFKVCGRSFWPQQDEALARLERARASGLDVAADAYPYTAYSTGLSIVLPAWAREGGSEAMLARLADPARRVEIAAAVRAYVATEPGDFDLIVISSLGEGGRTDAVGRSVAAIAADDGIEPVETLLRLLEQSRDEVSYVGFAMSEENVAKVLAHPLVCFGSDGYALRAEDADADRPHPRSYGAAVRLLARYCRDLAALDLQSAVRKLTAFPADRAGLADRGRLVPGCSADVVVFDLAALADTATYENPKRYPAGIERVWVNGVATVEAGVPTGERAGRVLRRGT
jgi:N-acyl-D-amino-acid deacylase